MANINNLNTTVLQQTYNLFEVINRLQTIINTEVRKQDNSLEGEIANYDKLKKEVLELLKDYSESKYGDTLANDGDVASLLNEDQKAAYNAMPDNDKVVIRKKAKLYLEITKKIEELGNQYKTLKPKVIQELTKINITDKAYNDAIAELENIFSTLGLEETINITSLSSGINKQELPKLGIMFYILLNFYDCNNCTFTRKELTPRNLIELNPVTMLHVSDFDFNVNISSYQKIERTPLVILKENVDNLQNQEQIINEFNELYDKYCELYADYETAQEDKKPKLIYDIMCILKELMKILVKINNKGVSSVNWKDNFKKILLAYHYKNNTNLRVDTYDADKFDGLYIFPIPGDDSGNNQYELYFNLDNIKYRARNQSIEGYLRSKFTEKVEGYDETISDILGKGKFVLPILYAVEYFSQQSQQVNVKEYLQDLEKVQKTLTLEQGKLVNANNKAKQVGPRAAANNEREKGLLSNTREIDSLNQRINTMLTESSLNDEEKGKFIKLIQDLYDNFYQTYDNLHTINKEAKQKGFGDIMIKDINEQDKSIYGYLSEYGREMKVQFEVLFKDVTEFLKNSTQELPDKLIGTIQMIQQINDGYVGILKQGEQILQAKIEAKQAANAAEATQEMNKQQPTKGGSRQSSKRKGTRRNLRKLLNKKRHTKKQ